MKHEELCVLRWTWFIVWFKLYKRRSAWCLHASGEQTVQRKGSPPHSSSWCPHWPSPPHHWFTRPVNPPARLHQLLLPPSLFQSPNPTPSTLVIGITSTFSLFFLFLSFSLVLSIHSLILHWAGSIKSSRRSSYVLAISTERSKSCDEGLNTFREDGRSL